MGKKKPPTSNNKKGVEEFANPNYERDAELALMTGRNGKRFNPKAAERFKKNQFRKEKERAKYGVII